MSNNDVGFEFYTNLLGISRNFHKGYSYNPYGVRSGKPLIKRETYDSNKSVKLMNYIADRVIREYKNPIEYLVSASLATDKLSIYDLNTKDMLFNRYHDERMARIQPYRIEEMCKSIVSKYPELSKGGLSSKLVAFSKFDKPELIEKRLKYNISYEIYLIIDSITNFTSQDTIKGNKNSDIKTFINKINAYSRYFIVTDEMKNIVIDYFYR